MLRTTLSPAITTGSSPASPQTSSNDLALYESLTKEIVGIYTINLSIFQSLPDSWGINQAFPVMPIHRLDESPDRLGWFNDITCDSDGRIHQFIAAHDNQNTLQLHGLRPEEPYFLGIFLVGAYQESLGSHHNLFGKIHRLYLSSQTPAPYFSEVIPADCLQDIVSQLDYASRDLIQRLQQQMHQAIAQGQIHPEETAQILAQYQHYLAHFSYLDLP